MGCSNCSNNIDGKPSGCKGNGDCGSYGCSKMDVFDWLSDMSLGMGQQAFNVAEVRFKNSRKGFYRNTESLQLNVGDVVAVESSPGHDIGVVSVVGELVRIQMQRKKIKDNHEIAKIYRKAKQEDIELWQEARLLEHETMHKARTYAQELGLEMKISDVEYQGDKKKATFYYTAEGRVDFRELIKKMADSFRTRIEMRQIGSRQEASRLGGIGSCGRELCCSTWLTDFRSVSTSAARYQQLSLNPTKLAGQCGKLKCCLNFELDQYMEAVKTFPSPNLKLHTQKGIAFHFKADIFKKVVWYIYEDQSTGSGPVALELDAVQEIIKLNKEGEKPADLRDFELIVEVEEETDYLNVVGQDSLTRFDQKKKRNKRRKGKGRGPKPNGGEKSSSANSNASSKKGNAKRRSKPKSQQKDAPKGQGGNKGRNSRKGGRDASNGSPKRNPENGKG